MASNNLDCNALSPLCSLRLSRNFHWASSKLGFFSSPCSSKFSKGMVNSRVDSSYRKGQLKVPTNQSQTKVQKNWVRVVIQFSRRWVPVTTTTATAHLSSRQFSSARCSAVLLQILAEEPRTGADNRCACIHSVLRLWYWAIYRNLDILRV